MHKQKLIILHLPHLYRSVSPVVYLVKQVKLIFEAVNSGATKNKPSLVVCSSHTKTINQLTTIGSSIKTI